MIAQRYRTILTKDCPSINRILEVVTINEENSGPFLITGGLEQKVIIYNVNLDIIQEIEFEGWIRCSTVADLDGDCNQEFIIGAGDSTLKIFKYSVEKSQFYELWNYKFENKVSSVAAGDINSDGRIEVIAGSWDNTIKVFDGLSGYPLWGMNFHDWVTLIKVLDVNWDGCPEIIIGLKKGQFGVLNGLTGECYWDYAFPKRINDLELIKFPNYKYPYLIAGGDDKKLYIFNYLGKMISEIPVEDRILSLSNGDIDGDNFDELIVSLGNNLIIVYETFPYGNENQLQSEELVKNSLEIAPELKIRWKAHLPNAVTKIKVHDLFGENVPKIIVTGYIKQIKVLQDFFYGKKSIPLGDFTLEQVKPSSFNHIDTISEISNKAIEDLNFEDDLFFSPQNLESKGYFISSLLKPYYKEIVVVETELSIKEAPLVEESISEDSTRIIQETIKSEESKIEKNVEFYEKKIEFLLSKYGNKTKKGIITLLEGTLENDLETINSAIETLKAKGKIKYSRSKPQGYFNTGDLEIKKDIIIETQIKEKSEIKSADKSDDNKTKFVRLIEEKGLIRLKSELKDLAISSGFTEKEFITLFDILKSEKILIYNKSSPRGYSISKNKSELGLKTIQVETSEQKTVNGKIIPQTKQIPKIDITDEDFDTSKKKFVELLNKNSHISSKQKLLDFMEKNGLENDISKKIIVHLKENGKLIYSRKKPQGYSIVI